MIARGRSALGVTAICFAVLLATGPQARAGVSFDLAPRIGSLGGNTAYQIGGLFGGPGGSVYRIERLSRLEFPLDVALLGAAAGLLVDFPYTGENAQVQLGGAFGVEAEFGRSFTRDAGKMKDSDWTEPAAPTLRTIYSESDAELDAETWEVRARFYPIERKGSFFAWRAGVGGGYLHQSFDFDVSNVEQWSIYPEYNGSYRGKVLTYGVTYEVPYAELAAGVSFGEGRQVSGALDVRLGYSPAARATDRDDHLLRQKIGRGEGDGDAVLFSLRGRITFVRHLFATIGVSRVSIDTAGTQTQTRYAANDEGPAGPIGSLDTKITSEQTLVDLAVGVAF